MLATELGERRDRATSVSLASVDGRAEIERSQLSLRIESAFASHVEYSLFGSVAGETCCRSLEELPVVVAPSRFLSALGALNATEDEAGSKGGRKAPAGPRFRIPPLRWRGTIGNNLTWLGAVGSSAMIISEDMNLSANTYVWQPWFLRVSLTGGMSRSSSTTSGSSGASKGLGLSGGATLDFFSQSRFPTSAFFSAFRSSTTAGGSSFSGGYNLGARSNYKPEAGLSDYRLSYARNVVTQNGIVSSSADRIDGGYSTELRDFLFGGHSLSANGGWNQSRSGSGSFVNTLYSLNGSASSDYYEDFGIRLHSSANFYVNQSVLERADPNSVTVLLLNSAGSWTPEEDIPLGVSGAANFSHQSSQSGGFAFSAQNAGASLSASYRYSQQIGLNGYVGTNWAQVSNGASSASVMGGVSASYGFSGESRRFGEFNYGWGGGAGAGISGSTGSSGGARPINMNVSSTLSHQLSRLFELGPTERMSLNMSQGVSGNVAVGSGFSSSLSSSMDLSYSAMPFQAVGLSASLAASDSRSFGQIGTDFQTISGSVNGSAQINRFSSVTAMVNGGFNRTGRSVTAGTTDKMVDAKWRAWGAANANYHHGRALGYKGLRYNAGYSLTPPGWGSETTLTKQAWTHAFSQGVSYRIGRISMSAGNSITIVGPQKNVSIQISVVREIGNY